MGAGIAAEDGDLRLSFRVGGQFSSTRSELVAIALRTMEQVQPLFILVDSATALQRLAWCRSREFCPSPRKIKDVDVMHDIMTLIRMRQDAGRPTTFVKVHGHSGDALHSVADHMARQGQPPRKTAMKVTNSYSRLTSGGGRLMIGGRAVNI